MSATSTSMIEYLALDGPIRPLLAIGLGVLLLGLFAWSLWREQRILGRRNTLLFWLLRAVALATVVWMLLAPMNVHVETATTRRAVVVMTDVSDSMQTRDPAGTSDELRWSLATGVTNPTDPQSVVLSADQAIAAVGMAQQHLDRTIRAIRQHQPESDIAASALLVNQALQHAREHLDDLQDRGGDRTVPTELPLSIDRIATTLAGPQLEAFDRLCKALEKERTPAEKGWRESLPDLQDRLAILRHELQDLGREVARWQTEEFVRTRADEQQSMAHTPRVGRVSALLELWNRRVLDTIRETADVQLGVFDETPRRLSRVPAPDAFVRPQDEHPSSATAAGTDLAAVLDQLQRDRQEQPLAAVFLLTDAAHNHAESENPREAASRLHDTPVYVVPVGNTQHLRDVALQAVDAPAVAMRNDDIVIEASLQAHDCHGEVCTVQLLQDGEVVDFREVPFDSSFASRTVRFEQQMPSVGRQQFQVAVTPLNGESTNENNYDEFEVNVTRSDIKVLLADERPRWEYRYLAQLFRRDAKVECDELLYHPRMIATGRREESRTVPVTVDEWDQYDVVLLGDLPTDRLPVAAQEGLTQYLKQRGGTLVVIAGAGAMPQAYANHPLAELLPVRPLEPLPAAPREGYAFRVTDAGREHHALMIGETEEATRNAWDFVNRFAPLHAVSAWRQPRPSAETLIAAVGRQSLDDEPSARRSAFLCWQPVGRGKVVYLSGPDTYRLRFLRGDRLHYRFWGQLLRWAIASDLSAGSQYVRIRTDKTRYTTRETVQVTVRLTDQAGEPVVSDEDLSIVATSTEDVRTVPLIPDRSIPGEYRGELTSLPAGVFRIEPTGTVIDALPTDAPQQEASASFTVQADLPQELIDTRSDRALAQQVADITGGQVLPPTAIEEILALTNLEPIVTERIERQPLWLQWKYLWIVFGCLQLEWIIRKWKGLS